MEMHHTDRDCASRKSVGTKKVKKKPPVSGEDNPAFAPSKPVLSSSVDTSMQDSAVKAGAKQKKKRRRDLTGIIQSTSSSGELERREEKKKKRAEFLGSASAAADATVTLIEEQNLRCRNEPLKEQEQVGEASSCSNRGFDCSRGDIDASSTGSYSSRSSDGSTTCSPSSATPVVHCERDCTDTSTKAATSEICEGSQADIVATAASCLTLSKSTSNTAIQTAKSTEKTCHSGEDPNLLTAYNLSAVSVDSLKQRGIKQLLPIQQHVFHAIFRGKDLIGRADTGTGKTLAFALPLVERLLCSGGPKADNSSASLGNTCGLRAVVLLPTRELAQQVYQEFVQLLRGRLRTACVYGGSGGAAAAAARTKQPHWNKLHQEQRQQEDDLRLGRCSVLVGCPGRVKDLINRKLIMLKKTVETAVLDEADRLLDLGFREDVEEILVWCREGYAGAEQNEAERCQAKLPMKQQHCADSSSASEWMKGKTQLLLFTATLPGWARGLADRFMRPDRVIVDAAQLSVCGNTNKATVGEENSLSVAAAAASVLGSGLQKHERKSHNDVSHLVLFAPWKNRMRVLEDVLTLYAAGLSSLTADAAPASAVVFAETKQQVNAIALESGLRRLAAPLHGDIPQQQREATLTAFKKSSFPYLVATDVAARGLHIDNLPLVVQLSPARDVDSFVHRAGRTGRAGRGGCVLTFAAHTDIPHLLHVEKRLGMQFTRVGVPQPSLIHRRRLESLTQQILSSNTEGSSDDSSSTECKPTSPANIDGCEGSISCSTGSDADDGVTYSRSKNVKNDFNNCRSKNTFSTGEGEEEEKQMAEAVETVLREFSPKRALRCCLQILLKRVALTPAAADIATFNGNTDSDASTVNAVPAANAASIHTEHVPLSCLNGREGFCTYLLRLREQTHQQQFFRTSSQVWRLLKSSLSAAASGAFRTEKDKNGTIAATNGSIEDLVDKFHSLTLTADGLGAVFDIAVQDMVAFKHLILPYCSVTTERQPRLAVPAIPFTISKAEELPLLNDALSQQRFSGESGNNISGNYRRERGFGNNSTRARGTSSFSRGSSSYSRGSSSFSRGSSSFSRGSSSFGRGNSYLGQDSSSNYHRRSSVGSCSRNSSSRCEREDGTLGKDNRSLGRRSIIGERGRGISSFSRSGGRRPCGRGT